MKVISSNKTEEVYRIHCPFCKAELEYDNDDIYSKMNGTFIYCPCCGNDIRLSSFEPLSFPEAYYSFENGVEIDNDKIREWTIEGIKFLERNKDEPFWSTGSGNTRVFVIRTDDDIENDEDFVYEIVVSKKYWNTELTKKEVKELIW